MTLSDYEQLPVKDSGSLLIKMYDGIVRTFDAWYVPSLRKNMISLGALDKQGYKFIGSHGQIKVLKEAMVVMKGKWLHGIYTLLGNTVMGIVVASSASKKDNDCTEL